MPLVLELMEGTSQQEGRALDMPTIHRYLRDTVSGLAYRLSNLLCSAFCFVCLLACFPSLFVCPPVAVGMY